MAKAPAAEPADLDAALAPIADQLYGLRPDQFAAARDEHIQHARATAQPALARELAKLRKPTQSAWLINLLWRDQQAVMEQLFELARELTSAQEQAAGAELRALMSQRRQLEVALVRRAHDLARAAGVDVSAAMEREAQETLAAALADPSVADQVRTGRLVKAASYAGFGAGVAVTGPPRATPAAAAPARTAPERTARQGEPIELEAAKRAREQRAAERAAATERLSAARTTLTEAVAVLRDRTQRRAEAEQQRVAAQRATDELAERLAAAQQALASADTAAASAAAEHAQAEATHGLAEQQLSAAQATLESLPPER